ncbi:MULTISPECIES: DUF2188 domain-containing protein [Corynebacterium]|uniref:DUF2188 domain-containing protein n=1 Tax=Corynebacterium TaxID=1716 RepID=UPI0008A1D51E|nr:MULTISPECIES: DUF2188 domain-containing protein [Corynebacterium]MCT1563238.1 DUF2188 domain-containing protein [Corynebacterium glucuronolyticum]OFO48719.1 hypothetical protein HMPREF3044_08470 [Corynebacterium sp. HMSC073D01]
MASNQYHVIPHQDGWGVKGAGSDRILRHFDTKTEASEFGRDVARNQEAELFYHYKDGRFQGRDSYGDDPFPPRG